MAKYEPGIHLMSSSNARNCLSFANRQIQDNPVNVRYYPIISTKNGMPKTTPLQVEEIAGDKFPDRDSAQDAALPLLAESLQAIIRDLLERGVLVKVNGKIIPNPDLQGEQ